MVTEEYRKEIEESLKSLKRILPQNTQVLFECVVAPDEDLQSVEECYLLVAPAAGPKRRVLKDLFFHTHLGGVKSTEREDKLREWLCKSILQNEQLVCDFVEEQSNGSFVPNRFPEEFKYYSPNTSFLIVLF